MRTLHGDNDNNLTPAFSTFHHGFSLKSLYRRCLGKDGPSLLVIQARTQVTS